MTEKEKKMDKKILMKRCLSLLAALVLVIAAGALSWEKAGYSAGRGNGTNAKITRVEELSSLLDDLFSSGKGGVAAMSALDGEETAYTSVTFSEVSAVYMDADIYIGSGEQSVSTYQKMSMQREMTAYITETDILYDSKGTISAKTISGGTSTYTDASFHIRLYAGLQGTMLRFDEFTTAQNGVALDPFDKILGKWIGFSSSSEVGAQEILSSMNSLNEMNFQILETMGDFLKQVQSDGFTRNGNLYRMTEDTFDRFAGKLVSLVGGNSLGGLPFDFDGGFEADLSDRENPRVLLSLGDELNFSQEPSRANVAVYETDEFIFSNINNTEIELSKELDAISFAEFAEIMGEE